MRMRKLLIKKHAKKRHNHKKENSKLASSIMEISHSCARCLLCCLVAASMISTSKCCSLKTFPNGLWFENIPSDSSNTYGIRITSSTYGLSYCQGGCTSSSRYSGVAKNTSATGSFEAIKECSAIMNCCNALTSVMLDSSHGLEISTDQGNSYTSNHNFVIAVPTSCGCTPCYDQDGTQITEEISQSDADLCTA